jgi:hypothetical protein
MTNQHSHYGHLKSEDEGYPLAAWIWGHRLRIGQHWMEYMLEFLNVLAGFEYEIGRGVTSTSNNDKPVESYKCFTRLGLRRFVFYDDKEKTRHPYDDLARQMLQKQLAEMETIRAVDGGVDPLELSKTLLRSLSAVEEQRSWYAKFLLPVHHNLLYWEALRKGATKYRAVAGNGHIDTQDIDENIVFDPRNFFARGGEIYYLMLSAGTEHDPELRFSIAQHLHNLLHNHNKVIGDLAGLVDRTWEEITENNETEKRFQLGWIPYFQGAFYQTVAEDMNTFLESRLDPLETLDLLAHLINFHLTLHIYFHSFQPSDNIGKEDSAPMSLLIDMLGGREGSVIRRISALLYQEQEALIVRRAETYVSERLYALGLDDPIRIDQEIRRIFGMSRLRKATRSKLDEQFDILFNRLRNNEITLSVFMESYAEHITQILMNDFRKNFLGVHRKLAKSIGFVAPQKGANARYVLGDNLLKALVVANVPPRSEMIYDDFLQRLYQRYGLIVGPEQARQSGLYDRQHINSEYYDLNRKALLEKMRNGGLAREYSDATAMVIA